MNHEIKGLMRSLKRDDHWNAMWYVQNMAKYVNRQAEVMIGYMHQTYMGCGEWLTNAPSNYAGTIEMLDMLIETLLERQQLEKRRKWKKILADLIKDLKQARLHARVEVAKKRNEHLAQAARDDQ